MSDTHAALEPLSWLFGRWKTVEATAFYPTMDTINYTELVEFIPTTQPVLQYKSQSWHGVKKCLMHCEAGFVRVSPGTKNIAFVVAHNYGGTEISEGQMEGESLKVTAESQAFISFPPLGPTTEITRYLKREGDNLVSVVSMATPAHPLQQHLKVKYEKVE